MDIELVLMMTGAVSLLLLPLQTILVALIPLMSRRHDSKLKQKPAEIEVATRSFSIWSRVFGTTLLVSGLIAAGRFLLVAVSSNQEIQLIANRLGSISLISLLMALVLIAAAIGSLCRSVTAVTIGSVLTVLMLLSLGTQGVQAARANPTYFWLMFTLATSGLGVGWVALGSAGLELSARRIRRQLSTVAAASPVSKAPSQPSETKPHGTESAAELIRFEHSCGKVVKAPVSMSGKLCECPRCGEMLKVPLKSPTR